MTEEQDIPAPPPLAPPLPDEQPNEPITPNGGMGALIPYKNAPALIGYYLGIFSLIPCLGLLLAIPAFILGIIGLRKAKQNPEVKGKGHAITALVISSIVLAISLFVLAIIVISALNDTPPGS